MESIFQLTLLVDDYDRAIAFYCGSLGFELVEDTRITPEKRWVVVRPAGGCGAALLLAQASTANQRSAIGHQTGGRVGFFLHTDEFDQTYKKFQKAGVTFCEEPRTEPYGRVVVFEDLFGNRWDLIEPTK